MENAPTDCRSVLERLYLYLDGEIADADCAAIERHIEACAHCFGEAEFERAFKEAIRRKCGQSQAPAELITRLRRQLREKL